MRRRARESGRGEPKRRKEGRKYRGEGRKRTSQVRSDREGTSLSCDRSDHLIRCSFLPTTMTTDSTVQNSSISTSSNSGGSGNREAASNSSNDGGAYGTPPDVIPNGHHHGVHHGQGLGHQHHQHHPHHPHPGLWDLAAAANPEHLGYELAATTGS